MKWNNVFVMLLVLIFLAMLWHVASDRAAHPKVMGTTALGPPPQASKPYNILDYTKPVVKP